MANPDDKLVALFKHLAVYNKPKSLKEGRPIFDDIEVVEIRKPGAKDFQAFPALAMSHWAEDRMTGEQTQVTYAERFSQQYRQFKASSAQTKSGTPLDQVAFLSEGRRAELRAQNIYTVEQLASIDGAELKNLGPGGREMKNEAVAFIEESKQFAPNLQMADELAALKARNVILEEESLARKAKRESEEADGEFDAMSLEQLKEFITTHTGHGVVGQPNRKTLVRMAENARPKAQVA